MSEKLISTDVQLTTSFFISFLKLGKTGAIILKYENCKVEFSFLFVEEHGRLVIIADTDETSLITTSVPFGVQSVWKFPSKNPITVYGTLNTDILRKDAIEAISKFSRSEFPNGNIDFSEFLRK